MVHNFLLDRESAKEERLLHKTCLCKASVPQALTHCPGTQLYEALVQLLRGDLPRGALRTDAPAEVVKRCTCNEQANKACRVFTEAWPPSLTWVDGAPLFSHELQPCPDAPHFRLQFFHMYAGWTHEDNTRDNMVLVRARPLPGFGAYTLHAVRLCTPLTALHDKSLNSHSRADPASMPVR